MIKVLAPATSANCSIGFDCMGMALSWFAEFYFTESNEFKITGCEPEFQTLDNMVVQAFKTTCDYLGKEFPTFHLHEIMDIPFQRGLGSSAACVTAGIFGADAWFQAGLTKEEMLKIADSIEGHPDNVAPAIYGSVCVSLVENEHIHVAQMDCDSWYALAMIPNYPIKTDEARKVLPDTVAFDQAKLQVARSILFTQALENGDEKMLSDVCVDYLHEPYRSQLIKEYDTIKAYCQKHDIAMWISGSGSTMLAISMQLEKMEALQLWVKSSFHLDCQIVTIEKQGTRVIYE